ncbi:MAG: hypothetical protein A2V66_15890 [Ignavibacteria bacterium RBG_13_36_8]|nr:MAG: hypothetical protein A2V66_15890 [Ignavibacteria bacterium RBG_13_36_8]
MGKAAKLSVSLIIVLFSLNLYADQINTGADQDVITILFIGSSYLNFHNLPAVFENLAISAGKDVYIDRRLINGTYLDFHASSEETELKIREQKWDYIVLQGAGSNLAYPDEFPEHPVEPSLVTLEQKIHSNSAETKMIYFMPWAFEDGMTWYHGWSDTYFDMQQIIFEKTLQMANAVDFVIAPVGWAFRSVMLENNQLHYLYLSDYNHSSVKGTYLAACVLYSTILKESCIGNAYSGEVTYEESVYFQTVASTTVLDNLELWKIISTGVEYKDKIPVRFNLYQNYPNPFNGGTKIGFGLKRDEFISLTVYDSLSRQVAVLVRDELPAGEHFVSFHSEQLSSGVYYYRLNSGYHALTRKMILLK